MNELENTGDQLCFSVEPPQWDTGGLLRTGAFSFFLHIGLIGFLMFSLKTGITKDKPPVYRVAIQPLSIQNDSKPLLPKAIPAPQPVPTKPQIQKEEIKPKEEAKKSEPVKETKQLKEEEVTVQKPVPLPMAETSTPNVDSKPEEEIPPTLDALSSEEKNPSAKPGTGIGSGGTPGGVGEGGIGGAGWSGIGEGTGIARPGGSGLHGSGFVGTGKGSAGGKGRGRGDSGTGSPRYAENPKPVYPLEALQKGHEGRVILTVEILPNGRVGEVQVDKSSGYETLDHAAIETVKKWNFIPAKKGGVAILCWVSIPFRFQLLSSKD
jgi:TonB family protein